MLTTARTHDGRPRATVSPDNHLRSLELRLCTSTELTLRSRTPSIQGTVLRDGHIVVDACTDVHDGIVIVRERHKSGYLEEVLVILVAVLEDWIVGWDAKLTTVGATTSVDLAAGGQEECMMFTADNLDNGIIAEVLLAQADHLLRELDFGVCGGVGESSSCLAHVVETPGPDITGFVNSE